MDSSLTCAGVDVKTMALIVIDDRLIEFHQTTQINDAHAIQRVVHNAAVPEMHVCVSTVVVDDVELNSVRLIPARSTSDIVARVTQANEKIVGVRRETLQCSIEGDVRQQRHDVELAVVEFHAVTCTVISDEDRLKVHCETRIVRRGECLR